MAIDYLPLDYNKIYNLFKKINKENNIYDYLDKRFCKYEENGKLCGRKSRCQMIDNCCKKHIKYMEGGKENKRIRKKDIIYKCNYLILKNQCKRNVKEPNTRCIYHKKGELPENENNKNDILLEYNIDNKTRRKEKIKNVDFQYIEKYRNMEMLEYLKDNDFEIENDGIRKKIKKEKWQFTINIKNNLFIDKYNKKVFGRGLLNLIIYIYKFNINDSINHINTYLKNKKNIHSFCFPSGQMVHPSENKSKMVNLKNDILPIKEIKNIYNINNYLINIRKIDKKIISKFINEEIIYSDNKNNCIFLNKEKTFSLSKGIGKIKFNKCSGIPDFIIYGKYTNIIYLFESPIDAISYIELHGENDQYISTNGEMMINKVITYVKKNNINKIFTCFDNDEAGDNFHNIIYNDIKSYNKNIEVIRKKPKNKDFNDDLKISKM